MINIVLILVIFWLDISFLKCGSLCEYPIPCRINAFEKGVSISSGGNDLTGYILMGFVCKWAIGYGLS
jgi:hypothetical protein